MLIIFGGLPGSGKTTIARELARQLGAVHVRIDCIEQALRESGVVTEPLNDAGYRVAYSVAEENLRLGNVVVADSVNPLTLTRDAWVAVAHHAAVGFLEVEIVCSDQTEHRRRVETRISDVKGTQLLTWQEVTTRKYDCWEREHLVIDAAQSSVLESVTTIRGRLADLGGKDAPPKPR